MRRIWILVVGVTLSFGLAPAHAQLFPFSNPFRTRPPALPPEQRVSMLLASLKTETDERKRISAIEDLREFDTKTFTEIVPALADIAQSDSRASVRGEAINSLVRIRPVTNTAGLAIENAASKEDNWRNRMNAQAALVRYRLAGYSSSAAHAEAGKTPPKQSPQSQEPPIADRPASSTTQAPPIYYYDQNGKIIPAPKGFPTVGPVTAIPTSNTKDSPFAPIAPSPVVPSVEPDFRPIAPPPAPTPAPRPAPTSTPPVLLPPTDPLPTLAPTLDLPPTRGPALDLPPLPINQTPPPPPAPTLEPPTVLPAPTPPSPPTATSPAPPPALVAPLSGLPSGRMEPSPRLTPSGPN